MVYQIKMVAAVSAIASDGCKSLGNMSCWGTLDTAEYSAGTGSGSHRTHQRVALLDIVRPCFSRQALLIALEAQLHRVELEAAAAEAPPASLTGQHGQVAHVILQAADVVAVQHLRQTSQHECSVQ
jgi:hypothetical protein